MSQSSSLREFQESLEIADVLAKLEKKYRNPPRKDEIKAVQGLRGASVVFMVATFEYFLRQVFEERLTPLNDPAAIVFERLPEKMRICTVYNTLDGAMKGPKYIKSTQKIDRIPDIKFACKIVGLKAVNPKAFSETGSNPNSDSVKQMFRDVGIKDVFSIIQPGFDKKWKKPTAHTFISDKLDEIVNHRHLVAHTAAALNISRSDLSSYRKFLSILANLLDLELEKHVKHLLKSCC